MKIHVPQIDDVGEPMLKAGQTVTIQRQVDRGYRQFLLRRGLLNDDFKAMHKKEARAARVRLAKRLSGELE